MVANRNAISAIGTYPLNSDPCPVCHDYHNRPETVFCSAKCTALANSFRRKIRTNLVKLTILNFSVEFIDGVYPKIHTPNYIHRFYPLGQTSFEPFWRGALDIQHAILGDLWTAIETEIGALPAQFIRDMNCKSSENIHEYRKRFETWCYNILQCQADVFICPDCVQRYIDAGLTRWYNEPHCVTCSTARIPF